MEVIVDRLGAIGRDVAEELGHPPLALAREQDRAD
jgi:hypothetical protein